MKLSSLKHFASLIVVFFLGYFGTHWFKNNGWTYTPNATRASEIYSLRTSNEVKGSFVLGIGSIGSRDYYIFYRKTESGGLIRDKIETDKCVLYESAGTPKVIESGQKGYHLQDGDTIGTSFERQDYNYYQSIYIPKGTITEHIKIDLN